MQRINTHLPTPMLVKLRRLATVRGVSVAELIRRAIEEFLAKPIK